MGRSNPAAIFSEMGGRRLINDAAPSVLMEKNPLNLSSGKAADIVDKLLTNAFNEGRGESMIKEIVRRVHKVKSWAAADAGHIAFIKELDRASMSPALRLFNLKAKADGQNEMLADETGLAYRSEEANRQAQIDKLFQTAKPPELKN